jgi:GNAT superfamily N-acetyltransferase
MTDSVDIRQMTRSDMDVVYRVFTEHDIRKPKEYIIKCWEENQTGERITLLAFYHGQFAGSLHLLANSYYPHFRENGIPEINDFNVIEPLKRRGIGSKLMEAVEKIAFDNYGKVGVGVGMHIYYGPAQRLYAKRGYVPDGRGLIYHNEVVMPGAKVYADNDLILYMTKEC